MGARPKSRDDSEMIADHAENWAYTYSNWLRAAAVAEIFGQRLVALRVIRRILWVTCPTPREN